MINLSVKVDDRAFLSHLVKYQTVTQRRAASGGLNLAGRKAEGAGVKAIARAKGLTISKIRWRYTIEGVKTNKRRLIKRNANRKRLQVGWVWSTAHGTPGEVPAILASNAKQTATGVRAGTATFTGAFIPARKDGQPVEARKRQVFKRTSRARLPLKVEKIALNPQADPLFVAELHRHRPVFEREYYRLLRVFG